MKTLKYKNNIIKIEHTGQALLPDILLSEAELNNKNILQVEFRDGCFNIITLIQTVCVFNLNEPDISVSSICSAYTTENYSGVLPNTDEARNHKFFVGV